MELMTCTNTREYRINMIMNDRIGSRFCLDSSWACCRFLAWWRWRRNTTPELHTLACCALVEDATQSQLRQRHTPTQWFDVEPLPSRQSPLAAALSLAAVAGWGASYLDLCCRKYASVLLQRHVLAMLTLRWRFPKLAMGSFSLTVWPKRRCTAGAPSFGM